MDEGHQAKTAADRKRAERERKRSVGIVTIAIDVPERHVKWLQKTASKLRQGGEPPGGFRAPIPLEIRTIEVEKQIPILGPVRIERVEVEKTVPGPIEIREVPVPSPFPVTDWRTIAAAIVLSSGLTATGAWLLWPPAQQPAPAATVTSSPPTLKSMPLPNEINDPPPPVSTDSKAVKLK
ncbi:MAG: hypothetical protein HQL42_20945 [Alphaproteobacteria bacterium]|nr:hypothetical protein [Alphaproteobacteria bacterium]